VGQVHAGYCHMEMSDGIARLPDGRRLGYARYGDPDGRPLVVCHGDAQSRLGYR